MFTRATPLSLLLALCVSTSALAKDRGIDKETRLAVTASALTAEQADRAVVGPGDAATPIKKAEMATVVRDGAMLGLSEPKSVSEPDLQPASEPDPQPAPVAVAEPAGEVVGPVEEEEVVEEVASKPASPPVPALPQQGFYGDPGLTAAIMGLTRSIDEQRMMNLVEARLADKQRLIDRLQSDVDRSLYGVPTRAPSTPEDQAPAETDAAVAKPTTATAPAEPAATPLAAATPAPATKPTPPPVAKSPADAAAIGQAQNQASSEAANSSTTPDPTTQAILDRLDAQQALLQELQAQKTAPAPVPNPSMAPTQPRPPVVAPVATPTGASSQDDERMAALEAERAAMAAELQQLKDTQWKLQYQLEHGTAPGVPPVGPGSATPSGTNPAQPGTTAGTQAQTYPQGTNPPYGQPYGQAPYGQPYPPPQGYPPYGQQPYGQGYGGAYPPPGYPPATPQDSEEIRALQARLQALEAENAVSAATAERDRQIALLQAQLAAAGAASAAAPAPSSDASDASAELEAMRAELEALRQQQAQPSSEAEALREAVLATESERARLDALAAQMQTLEQERAALAAELESADEARQAELAAEREANAARTAALEAELARLQARTQEMEKLYTNRYESVLAQLQPLIDTGLEVRVVAGKIKVELPSDVLFASGSATLSRNGREEVQKVAGALRPFRTMLVQVEGHTDNVPVKSFKYESNYDLAYARAKEVMAVMLEAGLDADRVSAASFGDTRPVAENDTRAGRARNRRIELNLELLPEAMP